MPKKMSVSLVFFFVLASCGGDTAEDPGMAAGSTASEAAGCPQSYADAEVYPVFVSSEVVAGQNRFLLGLLDSSDAPVATEDITVSATFESVDPAGSETPQADFRFIEIDPRSKRGLYVAEVAFPAAGTWAADVTVEGEGLDTSVRGCFEVAEESMTPAIGAPAPRSDTATGTTAAELAKISTDDDPLPRFYEVSVAEAIKAGDSFVLVFATPKYCSSQACGPTLDNVKSVAKDHPDVAFIHSEIYKDLEPTNPPLPVVLEWGLPSEPWVFVVDSKGRVAAKYEGTVSPDELSGALAEVT